MTYDDEVVKANLIYPRYCIHPNDFFFYRNSKKSKELSNDKSIISSENTLSRLPIRHKSKHKKIVKYQLLINLRNQHKTVSEERKGAFI